MITPPEKKLQQGIILVVPHESFGDWAAEPRKCVHKKLSLFERSILDDLSLETSDLQSLKTSETYFKHRMRRAALNIEPLWTFFFL